MGDLKAGTVHAQRHCNLTEMKSKLFTVHKEEGWRSFISESITDN